MLLQLSLRVCSFIDKSAILLTGQGDTTLGVVSIIILLCFRLSPSAIFFFILDLLNMARVLAASE